MAEAGTLDDGSPQRHVSAGGGSGQGRRGQPASQELSEDEKQRLWLKQAPWMTGHLNVR